MTGRDRRRDPRRGQRGLTLVELMVSMVLTGLLIGMVFTLFIQLSAGFRTQSQVADLQQALVATESVVMRDVRQAGFLIPNGFTVAFDADVHRALEITNASDGPDELRVYHADASAQARVVSFDPARTAITVDDVDRFEAGDLAVITDPRVPPANVTPAPPQEYDACVVRIAGIAGTTLQLDTVAPWGTGSNDHCQAVQAANAATPSDTMVYRFAAVGYRLDPDRRALGVLQRSATAGIDDDWEDLGIGFTDLQVASRWFEPGDVADTDDPDADPERDWYSSDDQDLLTAPGPLEPTALPFEVTVSVVVRTTRPMDGVVSATTPALTDPDNVEHNPVGDRAAVQLEGVADAARPEELRGNHIYRWSTSRVDLRNLGVGR